MGMEIDPVEDCGYTNWERLSIKVLKNMPLSYGHQMLATYCFHIQIRNHTKTVSQFRPSCVDEKFQVFTSKSPGDSGDRRAKPAPTSCETSASLALQIVS